MSNQSNQNQTTEEIDLGYLFRKIGDAFRGAVKLLFLVLAFFKTYWIITLLLVLAGVGYGIYKDANTKQVYRTEAIVIPNFESTDFLYDKVEAFNEKVSVQDTTYLKEVLGGAYGNFQGIKIEPVVDIFNFVSQSRENIDIFRIVVQNQEISEYVEDLTNSKYYKYHRIHIKTRGEKSAEVITKRLLDHINANQHYKKYQKIGQENTRFRIEQHELMVARIDTILRALGSPEKKSGSQSSVFVNDNSQLDDVLNTQRELQRDLLHLNMRENDEEFIVKLVDANYNILPEKGLYIPNKIKYPLLFVFLFSAIFFVRYAYRKMKEVAES